MPFPTLDALVGATPLAQLRRLPGRTGSAALVKREGNNPAGSVEDRPALARELDDALMVTVACDRGDRRVSTGLFNKE